jgi:hypothetical protein
MGFIMDLRDSAFDFVFYVTAHETAHQWWGHQIVGAAVEGAQFLSESLAEYSALMVTEHRYGPHRMRPFLKQSLDTYLRGRQRISDERPLAVTQSRSRKSAQGDKWSFYLTAGTLCLRIRSDHDETTPPEPHSVLQGEGCACGHQGRSDDRAACRAVRRAPEPDHIVEGTA